MKKLLITAAAVLCTLAPAATGSNAGQSDQSRSTQQGADASGAQERSSDSASHQTENSVGREQQARRDRRYIEQQSGATQSDNNHTDSH